MKSIKWYHVVDKETNGRMASYDNIKEAKLVLKQLNEQYGYAKYNIN